MWDLWNWNPYAFECGQELYVETQPKRKSCGAWFAAKGNRWSVIRRSCSRLRGDFVCWGTKFARAVFAGTNFAEMLETEDSGRVAIGKLDLQRVVPHRIGALGRNAWLVHGEQGRA